MIEEIMLWIGLGIGLFVGNCIGFFTFALCAIAKQSDREINGFNKDQKKSKYPVG